MSKVLHVKVGHVRCEKRIGVISWKERRVIRFDPFLTKETVQDMFTFSTRRRVHTLHSDRRQKIFC